MIGEKDVILAVMGASGSMAGLLLVFSGFIFSQAASFPAETADKVIRAYTKIGRFAVYPFCGFLAITLLSVAWLLSQSQPIYVVCITLFALLVVATGVYGALAAFRFL